MIFLFDLIENDSQTALAQFYTEIKCYDFIGPVDYNCWEVGRVPRHSMYEYCLTDSLKDGEYESMRKIMEDFRQSIKESETW